MPAKVHQTIKREQALASISETVEDSEKTWRRNLTTNAALTPQGARAGILRGGSRDTTGQERYRIAV